MTLTTAPVTLAPAHAQLVSATLPLIGAHIDEITTEFYRRMFAAHPELLRNLFNRGNQAQGAQQRALAASIATFATHLVDPTLPHPVELLSRIGHKHASLGVTADQYPIVHEHLFAAIVAVLGAETVTADVAEAWDRVFWIMADTLIDLERALYREAGVADGDVYRRSRVVSREDDPSGAVLISVRSVGEPFGGPRVGQAAGQYLSVGVTLPDGARQLRQYSLVNAPDGTELTFAVKAVAAADGRPAGEVSSWITDHVRVGDLLDVTVPFGDLPVPSGREPLLLISAGIGVTPMVGILAHLAATAPRTVAHALHADRSEQTHPLRERHRQLVAALPNATLQTWYEDRGLLDLDGIDIPADAQVYLCGNTGFVQAVRAQLIAKGVELARVHCELFAPNDWLLG
ncbi:MAG: globin domain-containing protein [Actinomycetota bacterium]